VRYRNDNLLGIALMLLATQPFAIMDANARWLVNAEVVLILKERGGIHRRSAATVGLIGVVIAMNPGGGGDIVAYPMVLLAASIYALILIWGKQLSARHSMIALVFSLHLGMGLVATALLPRVWVPVTPRMLAELASMAGFALGAHYLFAAAFVRAEASVLARFEYSMLIRAVAIGYLTRGDMPATEAWIGAVLIIATGVCVAHRESLRRPRS